MVPRQSSFLKGQRGASQDPGDMKVASRPAGGGPSVAPNETAGRPDPELGGKKKRPMFNQRYYQKSNPHQDYLHGNTDARREIISGDG